ncbi:MAG: hypothetical protein ABI867_44180 [Kofleriaceae bacterium]
MASLRLLFLSVLPATLIACGGGGDDGVDPPSGPHFTYVTDTVTVPENNTQAREIGLDLDDNGTIDNQLGMVLGTLAGQGFKVQDTLDEAVLTGSIILLLDLQSPSFTSTTGAGLDIKLGTNPTPAACVDPENLATCGKHLDGNGSFMVDPSSPPNAGVDGKIAGGVFSGGPGNISLQIALGGTEPIDLDLIGARAKATTITETGMGEVILAGAITQSDLDTKVIPAVHAQLAPLIDRDCGALPRTPPDCGCGTGSTGKTIIGLFDTTPKDCTVDIAEITNNSLIKSLLAPDVQIDGVDALSLGISVTAVKATIQ